MPTSLRSRSLILLALLAGTLAWSWQQAERRDMFRFPATGGDRIRTEAHLLPDVSTGPMDPCWSPDGAWIAFAMRGDIWKVPAEGGVAIALTKGPAYYFEPSWSPDGRSIALTSEAGGNLEIGIVPAQGGDVRILASHPQVDIEPVWSSDGKTIYFASARGGNFDIHSVNVESGAVAVVAGGPGGQIQPAVSLDGKSIAYIGPPRDRAGSAGIWVKPLPDGEARLVHAEEGSSRTRPRLSADGTALVFVSDEAGSNDIAAIPSTGGSVARLTFDSADEISPAYSPGGKRIAFTSNRGGPTRLFTMPSGGSRREGWTEVRITGRKPVASTGRARVRVVGPDGKIMPARISVLAADKRGYAPEGGFHRVSPVTGTHYFPSNGTFEIELPAGTARIQAMRGPEYVPATSEINIPVDRVIDVELRMRRLINAPAMGWYSGDTHVHDLHKGQFDLTHERFFEMLSAEDLHVSNSLIHMDGTRWMGRPSDLTGKPHPLSTPTHILQYGQEFRGALGHIGLIGIREFAMPLVSGTGRTVFGPDLPNYSYVDAARAQGGLGGFMHPYTRRVRSPEDGAGNEIALDVALGKGDFFDVTAIPYDDLANAEMYYRFLNAGFRLPASGGSDDFGNSWNGAPPGSSRVFAKVQSPFTMRSWLDALKAGRTFATTGPLLFLTVNDKEPGGEIRTTGPVELQVRVDVASIAPLEKVELVVNGEIAKSFDVSKREGRYILSETLKLEGSGWVAARALGPSSPMVANDYAFAQTTPVFIVREGRDFISAKDALFLDGMVAAMWQRMESRGRFTSAAEREQFRKSVEQARRVYQERAQQASAR